MKAQLLHLSGPFRGRTITYEGEHLLIGSDPDALVPFPKGPPIESRHAEIAFVPEGCSFYLRRIDGQVFVNRREIEEVILQPNDLIEIGVGGPKLRFSVHAEKGRPCKPVRRMLGDAREVARESGVFAFTGSITRDLLVHASPGLKIGLPLVILLVLGLLAYAGGWLSGQAKELSRLQAELSQVRAASKETVSRTEVDKLRAALAERGKVVDRLVASDAAIKRIHDVYKRGVCLLHGIYGYAQEVGEQVRYLESASGARLEVEYLGSGFLAGPGGQVVTNRHVAAPWLTESHHRGLLQLGYRPEFLHFTATFPGHAPVPVDPKSIRLRTDDVDVAVLHVEIEDVPVLPLFAGDSKALRGGRVVLVGYPTGINALLAKADAVLVRRLVRPGTSVTTIIEGLAGSGAISPVITQGSLSEVLAHQLVYDAETTHGGSGGPLFATNGQVIGVNYAILKGFGGSNFGVPIRFAKELMER